MKKLRTVIVLLLIALLTWSCSKNSQLGTASTETSTPQPALNVPTDTLLIAFAQQRTNAVRITVKPVKMHERVSFRCDVPQAEGRMLQKINSAGLAPHNPHEKKYAHVFISQQGAPLMRIQNPLFPRGTIILKEKFEDADGMHTELFTGMIKRESGYNPDCGDWEFFALPADAKTISLRGKLQSCVVCHVEYKDTDYVTRAYAY